MQTMKKLTALMLALSLIFTLSACSGSSGKNNIFDTKGTEAAQKTEPTSEETKKATEKATESAVTTPVTEPTTTEAPATTKEIDPNDPFAAIGSPAIDAAFVGTWTYLLDYATLMEASAGELEQLDEMTRSMVEAFRDLELEVMLDLRADGTCTFGIDEDSARAAVETIIPQMSEIIIPLMLNMYGMTEEELAAALEEQGSSMEEFKEQMMTAMQEQLDPEDMVASMTESTQNGFWRYQDGKLYIVEEGESVDTDQYMTVELSGNTLTVTGLPNADANEEMYEKMLPMIFTRK